MVIKQIIYLIQKEFLLEWRQKHALGGIMLYLVSTIFICYLSFAGIMSIPTWNALFWIIIAFASLNLVLKSFGDETSGRKLYLYTLAAPTAIIFSKILINSIVMIVLGVLGFVLFNLFMGNIAGGNLTYWVVLITGVLGFSSVLTMVSAIASQARNNFTLMAILGFPLILPLLLLLIRASLGAIEGASLKSVSGDLVVILLLVMISLTLSNILFPYLWKE
ncbi:MAG: heme exporter protein CcmB [Bacteroidales bacterium]|nr:heme exporter protein CcmB [Bacteroidales bacterium]